MAITQRQAQPYFSHPVRQLVSMLAVCALFGAGVYVAFPRVGPIFLSNIYLNGAIVVVFFIGVFTCFWQVLQLSTSVRWIEGFAEERPGHQITRAPLLLAPLAALLRSRGKSRHISTTSARSILDSVATRIEEARDITRYIVNLLIFLGLLGTFYGLATTVPAVVETIRSLAPQQGESSVDVFARLMTGLESQLGGMGTAFSTSLLGLTGSLVVGLLELLASHGQNRFYRELEEWLSTITRLGVAASESEGEVGESGVLAAVIEQMAEQMEALQTMFTQSDVSRSMVDERLGEVATAVSRLTERLEGERGSEREIATVLSRLSERLEGESAGEKEITTALNRLSEGQEKLIELISAGREGAIDAGDLDPEARMRLRSIDVQLLRILEEISAGRQETLSELRADLEVLISTLRRAAGEEV